MLSRCRWRNAKNATFAAIRMQIFAINFCICKYCALWESSLCILWLIRLNFQLESSSALRWHSALFVPRPKGVPFHWVQHILRVYSHSRNFGGKGIRCCACQMWCLYDQRSLQIDPSIALDKVTLLGCGVTTGYGSPINWCPVSEGSNVGVWGMGAIGVSVLMGVRDRKAKNIVAIDINPDRLKLGLDNYFSEILVKKIVQKVS